MATNFPSSLDSLTNPTSTDALNSPSHADQHANVNDAVEALEAKVGVDGSAVTSSLDFKVTASKTVTDKIDPAGASADQVLKFNGTKFVPATGSSLTASDTPPGSPVAGELWYESDTGRTFIRYDSAWVEIGSTATTNVNANDLSGTTLASNVVSSSLTSVGTLGSLAVTNDITRGGVSLPRGIVARATSQSTYTLTTTITQATGMSVTFTAAANRYYKITYYEPQGQTPNVLGNTQTYLRLTNASGTGYGNSVLTNETAIVDQAQMIIIKTATFSAGSVTLVGCANTTSTSGTPSLIRDSTREALLLVEDIGAV